MHIPSFVIEITYSFREPAVAFLFGITFEKIRFLKRTRYVKYAYLYGFENHTEIKTKKLFFQTQSKKIVVTLCVLNVFENKSCVANIKFINRGLFFKKKVLRHAILHAVKKSLRHGQLFFSRVLTIEKKSVFNF